VKRVPESAFLGKVHPTIPQIITGRRNASLRFPAPKSMAWFRNNQNTKSTPQMT